MNKTRNAFTLAVLTMFLVGFITPIANVGVPTIEFTYVDNSFSMAATNLVVTNESLNLYQEFNDDDFLFHVSNYSQIIAGARVTLINQTDSSVYDFKDTIGDGSTLFEDVPQGVYIWNVTWSLAPRAYTTGILRSDGPDALVSYEVGNLDWENDDDDFNATIVDIDGNPGEGLNFTIYNTDTNTTYNETILDATGEISLTDIPEGNFTYFVTVMSGPYSGTVISQANFTTDGTQKLVHQTVGPFAGDPEYYDLEVFTYFETSIAPLAGALVNVTFSNGTVIGVQTTPDNGTVQFLDLPVAFINWSVSYLGQPLGLGNYSYNLTTISTDVRSPTISSPGDQEFLFKSENITITWNLLDEFPDKIEIWFDDAKNSTHEWTNSTYDFAFNVTGTDIGVYEVKLVAVDLNGNTAEDIIELRIFENVTPIVDGPEDIDYYFTETGHSLRWNITDDYLNVYTIVRNGEEIQNGTIDPDNPFIVISVDNLEIDVYTYSFTANDTSGNEDTDEVLVTVLRDDIAPVFTIEPSTIFYEQGSINIIRNWTVEDDFMSTYSITVDGFVIVEDDWTEEIIEFDFSGLVEGTHFVVLTVYDLGGNSARSSVQVVVSAPAVIRYSLFIGLIAGGIIIIGFIIWYTRYR